MIKNKTKRKNMKGGAFTANQIHDFFLSQYLVTEANNEKDTRKKEEKLQEAKKVLNDSIQAHPLNQKNALLFNQSFQVFYIQKDKRIVVVHRGTINTLHDWSNNLRNLVLGVNRKTTDKSQKTKTARQLLAERGHKEIKDCLQRIGNRETNETDEGISIEDKKSLLAEINALIGSGSSDVLITVDEAVEQFIKTKMSVIGHSQGAIYAYLYGNCAAETIVYNPAPFPGTKPDNTFIIRRIGDPFSSWTNTKDNPNAKEILLEKLENEGAAGQHSISSLDKNFSIYGNKFLFSEDLEKSKISPQSATQQPSALVVTTEDDDPEERQIEEELSKEIAKFVPDTTITDEKIDETILPAVTQQPVNDEKSTQHLPISSWFTGRGGKTKRKSRKYKKRKPKSTRKYKK